MARVDWTKESLANVRDIGRFIHNDSPYYAPLVVARIFDAVKRLTSNPGIGWIVDEFDRDDLREILVYSYRIFYQLETNVCRIVAVVHASRDLQRWIDPDDFDEKS